MFSEHRNTEVNSKSILIYAITEGFKNIKKWLQSAKMQLVNSRTQAHFEKTLCDIKVGHEQLLVLVDVLEKVAKALMLEVAQSQPTFLPIQPLDLSGKGNSVSQDDTALPAFQKGPLSIFWPRPALTATRPPVVFPMNAVHPTTSEQVSVFSSENSENMLSTTTMTTMPPQPSSNVPTTEETEVANNLLQLSRVSEHVQTVETAPLGLPPTPNDQQVIMTNLMRII